MTRHLRKEPGTKKEEISSNVCMTSGKSENSQIARRMQYEPWPKPFPKKWHPIIIV